MEFPNAGLAVLAVEAHNLEEVQNGIRHEISTQKEFIKYCLKTLLNFLLHFLIIYIAEIENVSKYIIYIFSTFIQTI